MGAMKIIFAAASLSAVAVVISGCGSGSGNAGDGDESTTAAPTAAPNNSSTTSRKGDGELSECRLPLPDQYTKVHSKGRWINFTVEGVSIDRFESWNMLVGDQADCAGKARMEMSGNYDMDGMQLTVSMNSIAVSDANMTNLTSHFDMSFVTECSTQALANDCSFELPRDPMADDCEITKDIWCPTTTTTKSLKCDVWKFSKDDDDLLFYFEAGSNVLNAVTTSSPNMTATQVYEIFDTDADITDSDFEIPSQWGDCSNPPYYYSYEYYDSTPSALKHSLELPKSMAALARRQPRTATVMV